MASGMSLTDAIQVLIDNVETTARTAGMLANQKMQEDFKEMAKGTVDKYYEYQKGQYTKYGRTHSLYNMYDVTTSLHSTKGSVNMKVKLTMDAAKLEGLYHSNASEKWATVGGEYVLENFLAGRHPWTNAWPLFGASELQYKEIKASPNVKKTVNDYKKTYGDKYLQGYLDKIFLSLAKLYL